MDTRHRGELLSGAHSPTRPARTHTYTYVHIRTGAHSRIMHTHIRTGTSARSTGAYRRHIQARHIGAYKRDAQA